MANHRARETGKQRYQQVISIIGSLNHRILPAQVTSLSLSRHLCFLLSNFKAQTVDSQLHIIGKKCIRQYATDRVLASFGDASELLWQVVKGGDTTLYRYPCEPECQWWWILPGMRCDWDSNQAYPHIYGAIVLLKICSHNRTGSSSSSIRRIWWSLQWVKLV